MKDLDELREEIKTHETGAKTSGSLPFYECLTQEFIDRCAQRMTLGANKYGKYNWKKGVHDKGYILERLRHAQKHLMNLMRDIENGAIDPDDDAAACCVNIMMAMEHQEVYLKASREALPLDALTEKEMISRKEFLQSIERFPNR